MTRYIRTYFQIVIALTLISCHENEHASPAFVQPAEVESKADLIQFQSNFYLGSHLCREPMPPMDELKRDMEILKKNGFNLIKLQQEWAYNEPEDDSFDFSKYEELIAHAQKLGMHIYFGLTCEMAPAWLYEKYPDCRMIGHDGTPIVYEAQSPMPADGKPGPCFDHPGARAEQREFIQQLVKTLGRYSNVHVWNTWQEIGYWPDRLVGQPVCYCANTMNAFREWLKKKYHSLDELNKQWRTNYAKWKYVKPSRNYKQKIGLPVNTNWDYFIDNIKISGTLKDRAAAIRQVDTLNRPVFAHLGSWNYGSGKDWSWARSQDFLGSSSYPASNWGEANDWDDEAVNNANKKSRYTSGLDEIWRMLALRFDYLRSCNKEGSPVWAAEFQGGPVSTGFHKGRVPSANDMRSWMFTLLGSGVNTISFWVTRAEIMAAEANGFSLLDSRGDSTERFSEASRIGRALIKHADIFGRPSWPGAKTAILVNENNYQFCANTPRAVEHLEFSTRGWHRLLWEAGIPVDFLEVSALAEKDIDKYDAIIMPFPISFADSVIIPLSKYVENGGNLISEAGVARFDENGYGNRGEISDAASRLFGVMQTGYTMVAEPGNGLRWSPPSRSWGEFAEETMLYGSDELQGLQTRANAYIQTYECTDSKPCLMYGRNVAGTVRSAGKGRAWLLGTYVGHSGTAYKDRFTPKFVKTLMRMCGIEPAHHGKLLIRCRKVKGKEALIITNPTEQRVSETIDVTGYEKACSLFDEKISINTNSITVSLESLEVSVVLLQ